MEATPRIFVATKALIEHNGKILLLREAGTYVDGTNTGRYDVPGGRLTPGERFDEALLREVREETGLSITIGKPIAVNEWRPVVREESWQIVGIFFACAANSDVVTLSTDHDAFVWIEPERCTEYPIIENLLPIFETYLKGK